MCETIKSLSCAISVLIIGPTLILSCTIEGGQVSLREALSEDKDDVFRVWKRSVIVCCVQSLLVTRSVESSMQFSTQCLVQFERNCQSLPRNKHSLCQVEVQCENNAWWVQNNAPKVNLALYYETLCPDCQEFVRLQLWPTFLKVVDIFNLELVPYGNAREKQVGDVWEFACQHGPMECLGNLIQTCAIHLTGNTSKAFPFIACMEMSGLEPNVSAPACAKKHGIDYESVKSCTTSSLGNKLQHEMAVKTEQLDPPHDAVPWVTLNGVHTDEIESRAESELLKLLCDTYKGPKPDACRRTKALHKCQKDDL